MQATRSIVFAVAMACAVLATLAKPTTATAQGMPSQAELGFRYNNFLDQNNRTPKKVPAITVYVWSDEACTKQVGDAVVLTSVLETGAIRVPIKEGQNRYYLTAKCGDIVMKTPRGDAKHKYEFTVSGSGRNWRVSTHKRTVFSIRLRGAAYEMNWEGTNGVRLIR